MAPGDVTRSANRTFELLGAIVEHGGLTLGDAAKQPIWQPVPRFA